ncbi:MAG: RNA ligase, partial [Elusimicrobia bacterium]|nr:RNA ligase [Elusimicrobiota bacterium]
GRFLDYPEFASFCSDARVQIAPVLYLGPWSPTLMSLCDGKTTVDGADHCREGFVVRPARERWDAYVGRVILKMVGEEYQLRKGGTEGK